MEIKTRADYIDVLARIKKNIELYETTFLKYNSYRLFFANDDDIYFNFNESCIAHILGIDTDYLKDNNICTGESSYEIVKYLIDNEYATYNKIERLKAFNVVFSSFIDDKLNYFEEQIKAPIPNQLEFICKYDRSKSYSYKATDGYNADYYLCRKNEDGDLMILGLVKQNDDINSNRYCIQTNRIIKNDDNFNEALMELLHNQEITYATGLYIKNQKNNYEKNISLNMIETYKTLDNFKSYVTIAGAVPNTLSGHMYNLNTLSKSKKQNMSFDIIMSKVLSSINNKEIIMLDSYEQDELNPAIKSLIRSHNDYMAAISNTDSASVETFSQIQDERDKYRQDLESLKNEMAELVNEKEQLEVELEDKENTIGQLQTYKDEYEQITQTMIDSMNKIKRS